MERQHEVMFWGDQTVLYLVCGSGYKNIHLSNFIELYTKK